MALMARPTKAPEGDGKYEVPSEDNHRAAFVALVDLGTQDGNFGEKRELMVAWELLDEKQSTGKPFIVAERYTYSLNEKAHLRKVVEAALGRLANDEEVDLSRVLRLPVMLQLEHRKGKKSGKEYAAITGIMGAARTDKGRPQPVTVKPFVFDLSDGKPFAGPDWLPFLYGKSVADAIKDSAEARKAGGFAVAGPDGEGEADGGGGPDGEGEADGDTF